MKSESRVRFISVVACILSLLLLIVEYYSTVWMYHSVHLPAERHLGCFQFGVITNKAAVNIHIKVLYR